ncbi:hypothetical protein WBG78_15705 [Chryseolinea sp. T2]|uniref:hypothetical protein n=1 Tax=Chryseolinea sp. T2 TaxID=3129255 RepID=UPI00307733C7
MARRSHRHYLMNIKESRHLQNLPENITVYRAMTETEFASGMFGISWTTDSKIAEFFAFKYRRYGKYQYEPKVIHTLTVPKSQIIACFDRRKESEVIYVNQREAMYKFISTPTN